MINSIGSSAASAMMSQMQSRLQPDATELASQVMTEADTDGDSLISESEFSSLMSDADSSDVDGLFAEMDSDGDGSLSSSEMEDTVSALIEQLQAAKAAQQQSEAMGPPPGGPMGPPPDAETMVSDNDSDGDGYLSEDEFSVMLGDKSESEISELFTAADTDGDGLVSDSELETAMAAEQPESQSVNTETQRMMAALLSTYQSEQSETSSSVSVSA